MVAVMAECVRARHRELLQKARAISLTADDKGRWRLLRFKCSYREDDGKAGPMQSCQVHSDDLNNNVKLLILTRSNLLAMVPEP